MEVCRGSAVHGAGGGRDRERAAAGAGAAEADGDRRATGELAAAVGAISGPRRLRPACRCLARTLSIRAGVGTATGRGRCRRSARGAGAPSGPLGRLEEGVGWPSGYSLTSCSTPTVSVAPRRAAEAPLSTRSRAPSLADDRARALERRAASLGQRCRGRPSTPEPPGGGQQRERRRTCRTRSPPHPAGALRPARPATPGTASMSWKAGRAAP